MKEGYCNRLDFEGFMETVWKGLKKGKEEYGEESFLKNNVFLMIEEELRDVAAYAFLASRKLEMVRKKFIEDLKGENDETSATAKDGSSEVAD